MAQIGDRVVYGAHGVCIITDETVEVIDRKRIRYFILEPMDRSGASYYVPADHPAALEKLRPLLTKEELDALLSSHTSWEEHWIQDENRRKLHYRELIAGGDREGLLQMVHSLYKHKKAQQEKGRKFHLCDESFLKDAQRMLDAEFSVVLGIPSEEVGRYVLKSWNE